MIGLKGNGLEVDFLTDTAIVHGKKMSIDDFRKMCFENNWEGTLYKIDTMARAIRKTLMERYGIK